jgi:hypothetical protein
VRNLSDCKICDMESVREYMEGYQVELHRDQDSGRLVIRATNDGGSNATLVDLLDLIEWLRHGPQKDVIEYGCDSEGDRTRA